MRVLCILQNAWGNCKLPCIFEPNPRNKSAKTIRTKVLEPEDTMHFANTTDIVTATASGRAKINEDHFCKVLQGTGSYDIILVCGNQAKEACERFKEAIAPLKLNIVYMPHPASRTLSNVMLAEVKQQVDKFR